MAKKLYIPEDHPDPFILLGIASDDRIWKLSWEINKCLGIKLIFREIDSDIGDDFSKKSEDRPALISADDSQVLYSAHYYEDSETKSRLNFLFFEKSGHKLPTEIKGFSFFLKISSPILPINAEAYIQKLQHSKIIRSVIDLTHIDKINQLRP